MHFASPLVHDTKLYRTLVVALALAEVLVEGGERVGIPGLTRPTGSRNVIDLIAQAIVHDRSERPSLPPNFAPSPLAEVVLLSDLWSEIGDIRRTLTQLSGSGAHGHAVQIVDPAEETFLIGAASNSSSRKAAAASPPAVPKPGARIMPHALPAIAPRSAPKPIGWVGVLRSIAPIAPQASFSIALHAHIGAAAASWRFPPARDIRTESAGMIGALPLGFAEPFLLAGLLTLPVLWWLLRLIPPRPRRIDFPPTRLLLDIVPKEETPARTPWWLTLMRLVLAGTGRRRRRWTALASAARRHQNPGAGRDPDRRRLVRCGNVGSTASHRRRYHRPRRGRSPGRGPCSAVRRPARYFAAPAGSARVRLHQLRPAPYTVDRGQVLPALSRFLAETKDAELVWLSDATDLGHGADFVKALGQTIGQHPITVVAGGIAGPRALTGVENAAGALPSKCCAPRAATRRTVPSARSTSKACRLAMRRSRSSP